MNYHALEALSYGLVAAFSFGRQPEESHDPVQRNSRTQAMIQKDDEFTVAQGIVSWFSSMSGPSLTKHKSWDCQILAWTETSGPKRSPGGVKARDSPHACAVPWLPAVIEVQSCADGLDQVRDFRLSSLFQKLAALRRCAQEPLASKRLKLHFLRPALPPPQAPLYTFDHANGVRNGLAEEPTLRFHRRLIILRIARSADRVGRAGRDVHILTIHTLWPT